MSNDGSNPEIRLLEDQLKITKEKLDQVSQSELGIKAILATRKEDHGQALEQLSKLEKSYQQLQLDYQTGVESRKLLKEQVEREKTKRTQIESQLTSMAKANEERYRQIEENYIKLEAMRTQPQGPGNAYDALSSDAKKQLDDYIEMLKQNQGFVQGTEEEFFCEFVYMVKTFDFALKYLDSPKAREFYDQPMASTGMDHGAMMAEITRGYASTLSPFLRYFEEFESQGYIRSFINILHEKHGELVQASQKNDLIGQLEILNGIVNNFALKPHELRMDPVFLEQEPVWTRLFDYMNGQGMIPTLVQTVYNFLKVSDYTKRTQQQIEFYPPIYPQPDGKHYSALSETVLKPLKFTDQTNTFIRDMLYDNLRHSKTAYTSILKNFSYAVNASLKVDANNQDSIFFALTTSKAILAKEINRDSLGNQRQALTNVPQEVENDFMKSSKYLMPGNDNLKLNIMANLGKYIVPKCTVSNDKFTFSSAAAQLGALKFKQIPETPMAIVAAKTPVNLGSLTPRKQRRYSIDDVAITSSPKKTAPKTSVKIFEEKFEPRVTRSSQALKNQQKTERQIRLEREREKNVTYIPVRGKNIDDYITGGA
jgi:hypothetical protein